MCAARAPLKKKLEKNWRPWANKLHTFKSNLPPICSSPLPPPNVHPSLPPVPLLLPPPAPAPPCSTHNHLAGWLPPSPYTLPLPLPPTLPPCTHMTPTSYPPSPTPSHPHLTTNTCRHAHTLPPYPSHPKPYPPTHHTLNPTPLPITP